MKTISRLSLAILISFSFSPAQANTKKVSPVLHAIIQEILQNRIASNYKNFSVKKCPKHKVDWTSVILKRQKQNLEYKFAVGCDIEGTIAPQVLSNFPVNFKIRNLDTFQTIKGEAKLAPTLATKPLLRLDLSSTTISSPTDKIVFSAYYETEIDPFSKEVIGKHLGGKIFIEEVNGKRLKEELTLPPAQK